MPSHFRHFIDDVLLFILYVASKDVVDAAPSREKADVSKWTVDDVTKWLEKIGLR